MVKLHSKEVKSGCVTTESEFSGSNMYALASFIFCSFAHQVRKNREWTKHIHLNLRNKFMFPTELVIGLESFSGLISTTSFIVFITARITHIRFFYRSALIWFSYIYSHKFMFICIILLFWSIFFHTYIKCFKQDLFVAKTYLV